VTRFGNRVTIYDAECMFGSEGKTWHDFGKRDTILTDLKHVLSTPWPICCVSLVNLMETKGGNF